METCEKHTTPNNIGLNFDHMILESGEGGGGFFFFFSSSLKSLTDPFLAAFSTPHRFGVADGIVSPRRRGFNLNASLYFHRHVLTDLPSATPSQKCLATT